MKIFWINGTDGNFNTATNWQTDEVTPVNQVPGADDIAVMTAPGTYTVQDDSGGTTTVLGFTTGSGTTLEIGSGTIFTATEGTADGANAGQVDLLLGSYLTITDGTLNNTGSIGVNTASQLNFTGSVTITGGGAINLISDDSYLLINSPLTNVNNTIQGTGTIVFNYAAANLTEDAAAEIDADDSGDTLTLEGEENVINNNHSLLVASNNGTLVIQGLTLNDATGGGVSANGGTVEIGGISFPAVVVGGTLSSLAGGVITLENASELDGGGTHPITNDATLGIADNATVTMAGTINNTGAAGGVIDMNSTGDPTVLTVGDGTDTTLTLQGSGDVVLSNTSENLIVPEAGTFKTPIKLINVNNDISGDGFIAPGLTVDNEKAGLIDGLAIAAAVDNAGTLENVDVSGPVTNTATGMITASTGANALIEGSVTGGTLKSTGTGIITASGGTLKNLTNSASLDLLEIATLSGTIKNTGSITTASPVFPDITLAGPSFTLTGNGTFQMPLQTTISGSTANTVFNNDGNTISGEGLIDNLILHNTAGTIDANGAAPLIIDTGTHAIVNAALLSAEGGGELYLASSVSNTGALTANGGTIFAAAPVSGGVAEIYGSGEIEFGARASTPVKFEPGSTGMLVLDDPTQYTGTISGFADTQGIDLAGIAPTAELQSFSGGVLTINDSGELLHLHFSGSYTLAEFSLASDGGGGSILTDPEPAANAAAASNIALLGSYMASAFASPQGGISTAATAAAEQSQALLAHPHIG